MFSVPPLSESGFWVAQYVNYADWANNNGFAYSVGGVTIQGN
jgi:hypothetical protein